MSLSRKVLCAIDLAWQEDRSSLLGATAEATLLRASREAALIGGDLVVLHALPVDPGVPMSPAGSEAMLMKREELASIVINAVLEAVARLPDPIPQDVPILVEDGPPTRAILDAARRVGAELIVLGNVGARGGLVEALLGRVADAVVRAAPCSVLVVRPA